MPSAKLILASGSPQRKRILKSLGLPFTARPARLHEHHDGLRRPAAIAKSLALRKARFIAQKHPRAWVLGCDTLVVLRGKILGKPQSRAEAQKVIESYSGHYCDVYSGLALVCHGEQKTFLAVERTRVHFRKLQAEEISRYLSTKRWKGSSGSLTIEDAGDWITGIKGDYWNVVGLPVGSLKELLKKSGFVKLGRVFPSLPNA